MINKAWGRSAIGRSLLLVSNGKEVDMKKKLGIYIHIPFCEKKCDYCDFLSGTATMEQKEAYVQALIKEIQSYEKMAREYKIETVFIGGGTPTSLEGLQISRIIKELKRVFSIIKEEEERIEFTIEANPGTLTKEKSEEYKASGVNRLSIGLQSADNKELKKLGRIHTFEEFVENYEMARKVGFENINIDLISSLPGQSKTDWEATLNKVVALNPEHISAYSLIIEEGTPFYDRYSNEKGEGLLSEDTDREIYNVTKDILLRNGYHRYEISNYARAGYESRHNSSYWTRVEYLGIGLGASSFLNQTRHENESDMETYIKYSFDYNKIKRNIEVLTKKQQMEEFMFLGLRRISGIHPEEFFTSFGETIEQVYGSVLRKLEAENLLIVGKERIYLTDPGIDISNYIFAQFLLD